MFVIDFLPRKKSEEHTWIRLEKPQELNHKDLLFEEPMVEILSSPDFSSVGETEFAQGNSRGQDCLQLWVWCEKWVLGTNRVHRAVP